MGSIVGRESEEILRLQDAITAVIERVEDGETAESLAEVLRDLHRSIDEAKERYWARVRELHRVRDALKLSG
jgi:hypothetical protein